MRNKQKPQQFGKSPDIHDKAKCFTIEIMLTPQEAINILENKSINDIHLKINRIIK